MYCIVLLYWSWIPDVVPGFYSFPSRNREEWFPFVTQDVCAHEMIIWCKKILAYLIRTILICLYLIVFLFGNVFCLTIYECTAMIILPETYITRFWKCMWWNCCATPSFNLLLSFSIYCQTFFRVLSAGVLCTIQVAGWKPKSNHIWITIGFFNLHRVHRITENHSFTENHLENNIYRGIIPS